MIYIWILSITTTIEISTFKADFTQAGRAYKTEFACNAELVSKQPLGVGNKWVCQKIELMQ